MIDFMIVGVVPASLINFRLDLIKAIQGKNKSVLAVSSELHPNELIDFESKGIKHSSVYFNRSTLNPFSDLKTFLSLYRLLKKKQPKKVLFYTIKPVIWGGLASRITGVRYYCLITGLGYAFKGNSLKRKVLTFVVSFLYKISLKHATKVIFQNSDNLNLFVSKGLVTNNKAELVNGSGVNLDYFSYSYYKPKPSCLNFLCVSRLLGAKGLREYAEAARLVKLKYPNVKFMLVGPTDTSPDSISVSEVNSWTCIDYLGSKKDVRPFLYNTDIFVLPSYHEGLPRSTIEAMSVGLPIITTDTEGCKETVICNVNGFKVPIKNVVMLAEKMIWFIENNNMIEVFGLNSRKLAEQKFDVNKINSSMLKIMEY